MALFSNLSTQQLTVVGQSRTTIAFQPIPDAQSSSAPILQNSNKNATILGCLKPLWLLQLGETAHDDVSNL
ncbi:MAG: hypothetical protein KME12_10770 [Trichocoleus desertorum ATA4-8-CV12]|jgi:hypothetical protein|nr:hypothetical protein [Trichocoleus desertorum ATA4-8-CV12]